MSEPTGRTEHQRLVRRLKALCAAAMLLATVIAWVSAATLWPLVLLGDIVAGALLVASFGATPAVAPTVAHGVMCTLLLASHDVFRPGVVLSAAVGFALADVITQTLLIEQTPATSDGLPRRAFDVRSPALVAGFSLAVMTPAIAVALVPEWRGLTLLMVIAAAITAIMLHRWRRSIDRSTLPAPLATDDR